MQRYLKLMLIGLVLCQLGITAGLAADSGASGNQLAADALKQFTTAKHYIWTDNLYYMVGDSITLRWVANPMDDPYPYVVVVYWENINTGERKYVANGALSDNAVDAFGNDLDTPGPIMLPANDTGAAGQPLGAQLLQINAAEVGNYHFVAELRDVTGANVVKKAFAKYNVVSASVDLGFDGTDTEITSDTTWTADKVYKIRHQVFVNDGAKLTIEPGTIVAAQGQNAVLVVERGGELISDGRRELPIVMTCDKPVGERFSGCWAGIIALGKAPNNIQPTPDCPDCVGAGEGIAEGVIPAERPRYGGTVADDSSGVFRYTRVEFAGVDVTDTIQPNAFGMHALGSGTVIDYIQAHEGEDDGVEFFGGTANAKHVVATGAKDDSLDWTFGWTGTLQYAFVQLDQVEGERGLENDGNEFGHANTPLTHPRLLNMTIVGSPVAELGWRLRRGASVTVKNSIFMNFPSYGFRASDDATLALMNDGTTIMDNMIFWNNAGGAQTDEQIHPDSRAWVNGRTAISYDMNPMLRNVRYEPNPDPRPRDGSIALKLQSACTPGSDGLVSPDSRHVGGFNSSDNWLEEWTWFGSEEQFIAQ